MVKAAKDRSCRRTRFFRFQRCFRLEARSQDTEKQLEQIAHQDASLRRLLAASTPNRIFGTHSLRGDLLGHHQPKARRDLGDELKENGRTVCTENSNPEVMMVKPAQDGVRTYETGSLNPPRIRRIFV
jgi:hypothetical protein